MHALFSRTARNNFMSSSSVVSTNVPHGKRGTQFSCALLLAAVFVTVIAQNFLYTYIDISYWTDSCSESQKHVCQSNGIVFRASFALAIFFFVQIVLTVVSPRSFDQYWSIKILFFVALAIAFVFSPQNAFNSHGYAWFARFAGFLFVIMQQVILLDVAYTWNERWLDLGSDENGELYLYGLLGASGLLIGASYTAMGLMYWQFTCTSSAAIISLNLIMCLGATLVQLFLTEEGSLLTSAVVTAYSTYLCYSAVSLSPSHSCNPTITATEAYSSASQVSAIDYHVMSII